MSLVELRDAPPPPGHVKLRVAYCGICGSDLHEYESANPPRALGFMQPVMGHEFSGRVVALGEGVDGVRVGQLVTLPERSVVPLPDGADLRLAALTEPFAVARHALAEANYRPDELLVIAGAGPIGLLTAIAARQ